MVEMSFIKTKSKDFGGGNSATFIEMKFKLSTATRNVGIHESFCISKRIEEGFQGCYLLSQFQLFF